jgi:DNA-binding transcriptional LysR family regulator
MLLPVSLQDIQYFLAIVQFDTLIKAADYLNVTQPLLSKRMKSLQETVGITLFKHSKRNIVLTPAGKLLYKEWGQIIQSIESSVAKAEKLQKEHEKYVVFSVSNGINQLWRHKILEDLDRKFPEYIFETMITDTFRLVQIILENQADFAILPNFGHIELLTSLHCATVSDSMKFAITVSKTHPLSKKETLTWKDIKGYDVFLPLHGRETLETQLISQCNKFHFMPSIKYVENIDSSIPGIIMNKGVIFSLGEMCFSDRKDLSIYPMDGSTCQIVLAWRADSSQSFVRLANNVAQSLRVILSDLSAETKQEES